MPFNCFKYNNLYNTSKRYHTAAKQSAAFFDSSFNYIKQNSQVVVSEAFANGAKRVPNPHPVNSISANYLQIDYNDDRNNLKNPINIVLPYNQDSFVLSIQKNDYQQIIKKLPIQSSTFNNNNNIITTNNNNNNNSSKLVNKLNIHKNNFHTQAVNSKEAKTSSSPVVKNPVDVVSVKEDVPKYFTPIFEANEEQNDETFLKTQTIALEKSFEDGHYERINSYYMALKRNNIVPSRDIFTKVLYSISKRTIDDTTDEQLSVMLNVYQDMISNKIKPDLKIYSIVINQLLESSIKAAFIKNYSTNGSDFFKIAIDIFNASNSQHIQQFDSHLINQILIGMNIYPGFINSSSFIAFLNQQKSYNKTHIYYSSLINYCKYINDHQSAVELYEEFKEQTLNNEELSKNQFIIYSTFISTLIETKQISLATKFMDKLLTSIKNYEGYESKVTMLLSSYLLTLSKQNPMKAFEIWAQFNRIDWIPEFSYEFYMNLLNDSLADYKTALKLYNYMTALPIKKISNSTSELNLDTLLITPQYIDSISSFLLNSIDHNDKSTVLKILKESLIKKTTFNYENYVPLFQFINNEELSIRITNSHGLSMKDGFEFLTFLTTNVANFPVFEITKTEFFKKLINDYSIEKIQNYYGFYQVFNSLIQTKEITLENLELISPIIIELHDLNNYYFELDSIDSKEFKEKLTNYFNTLVNELDISNVSSTASNAMKLVKGLHTH